MECNGHFYLLIVPYLSCIMRKPFFFFVCFIYSYSALFSLDPKTDLASLLCNSKYPASVHCLWLQYPSFVGPGLK